MTNERLSDLVRHQRSELHVAGLISDDEYVQLLEDHSAVARLETYDSMKSQIAALKSQLNESEMHRHELMERLQDRVAEIATLQSQVAILEESNKGYQRTAQTILEIKAERDALMEAVEIYERLLSTPASGEPARKP